MVANPICNFVLTNIFSQGLADDPVRNHLLRIELKSLDKPIITAVQEDFSVRQAHTDVAPYRPPRQVEAGGLKSVVTSHAGSESS